MKSVDETMTEGVGTLSHMDPAAVESGNNYHTDMYSFCALASEVLSGQLILNIQFLNDLKHRHDPFIPNNVPQLLRDCLEAGFNEDQAVRPTWDDVIDALHNASDLLKSKVATEEDPMLDYSQRRISIRITGKCIIVGAVIAVVLFAAIIGIMVAILVPNKISDTKDLIDTSTSSTDTSFAALKNYPSTIIMETTTTTKTMTTMKTTTSTTKPKATIHDKPILENESLNCLDRSDNQNGPYITFKAEVNKGLDTENIFSYCCYSGFWILYAEPNFNTKSPYVGHD